MKVYISADMEGISCVVHGEHTSRDGKEHQRARKLMTAEVNAAIEGALQAGATDITVNDSHGTMRNIIPEELKEEAKLITGSPKPFSMMEGITDEFNAAFFIGYHSRRGTHKGILEHSFHGRIISDIRINDKSMGETGINAALAGYHNVPVALVTGDSAVTKEAQELLGSIETVSVKEAVSRYAAECLHPKKARKLIKSASTKALKKLDKIKPLKIKQPITIEIDFINAGMADMAELLPYSKRTTGTTITYREDDLLEALKALQAAIALAASVS